MDNISFPNISEEKIKIIIADDYPLIREGLRACIEKAKDLEIVAETGDGKEAVNISVRLNPDLVIIDDDMPILNGLEAAKQILKKCPHTEILMLIDHEDSVHILDIINAGASGYAVKSAPTEVLIHYIRAISSGGHAFPSTNLKFLPRNVLTLMDQSIQNKNEDLTSRELAILKLLGRGLSNKDIALRLGLSLNYIKANLTNIFMKLGVSSRTEAISNSLNAKILTLNDLKNTSCEN